MTHRTISRRMALLASVAVLGLAACGAPETRPTGTDAGPARLQLVAGGGGGANAASGSAEMAGMSIASDTMMMPAFIEYVYAGDVPDLTAPAGSWFFPAAATASAEQVQRLADAFGVSGEVEQVPADEGGGWRVGAADWSGSSVQVMADGMSSWWFNPGPTDAMSAPGCVIAVDPPVAESDAAGADGTTTDAVGAAAPGDTAAIEPVPAPLPVECVEPPAPANVPDAAAAEATARDLFAAVGVDMSSLDVETYADDWGAYVTGYLRLEDARTWLSVSVGFGAEGAITWAGGFLADPQRGDDYPRIGVEAAVARLNDQASMWMYPMVKDGVGLAAASEVTEDLATVEPGLVDPVPMPVDTTPIVVTLSSPTPSLEMFWAADGTAWLLPGYQFAADDGGVVSVLAVPDEFIEQAEPAPVDTLPVDTVPVDTSSVDTSPVGPAPVDTVAGIPPLTLEQAATIVVGLGEADAAAAATAAGIEMRVVQIDGVPQAVTEDYRVDRYNVAVDGGVVTAVLSIG